MQDLVEDHPDIDWVGNWYVELLRFSSLCLLSFSNELNAAYAADGYARVKHNSLGVVLTT
jgi:TPP-dependent 2-oxoacid decarboxylase